MQAVYGDQCVNVSTVRQWVRRFKDGELGWAELSDKTRSGRPVTASNQLHQDGVEDFVDLVILQKHNYAALKIIDVDIFLFLTCIYLRRSVWKKKSCNRNIVTSSLPILLRVWCNIQHDAWAVELSGNCNLGTRYWSTCVGAECGRGGRTKDIRWGDNTYNFYLVIEVPDHVRGAADK